MTRALLVACAVFSSACGLIDAVAGAPSDPGRGGEGEGDDEGEGEGEGEVDLEGDGDGCDPAALPLEARAVAVGFDRSCALLCDGAVRCWGAQSEAPAGGPFGAIAVSSYWACARTAAGDVRCAGQTSSLSAPELDGAPVPMQAIGAGQNFLCGIDDADSIECWGTLDWPSFDIPSGAFGSLSVGWGYVCGHRLASGELVCGGTSFRPVPPDDVALTQVGVGSDFGCGLDGAGAIHCFSDEALVDLEVPAGAHTALGVGDGTACAVRAADAALVCFGNSVSDTEDITGAVPPGRFRSVAVASKHACAIREDHAVVCFGDDTWGRTSVP